MENNRYHPQDTVSERAGQPLPGATLAAARVARGLSEKDVARLLKLSVAQVKAIEADDYSQLQQTVFVRGFIRNYARILRVDIESLLPVHVEPAKAADVRMLQQVPKEPLEPQSYRYLTALAASSVFALLGLSYYEFVVNTPPPPFQVASTAVLQPLPSLPVYDDMLSAATSTARESAPGMQSPQTAAVDALQLKSSSEPVNPVRDNALHFQFNSESWVEVRDGVGKVVFSKTNPPGSESVVHGDPPFSLVVGAASGVQLNYNGNRVDLASHASHDVARLRLE